MICNKANPPCFLVYFMLTFAGPLSSILGHIGGQGIMKKNPVKVCLRTRPTANFAQDQMVIDQDQNTITINSGHVASDGGPSNKKESWQFKYHQVLHNASQETVYETITRDVVQGVVEGINGTIMSYGQTGAGKTFTMIGDTKNYVHRGIAPRALAHIFQEVQQRVETVFEITVSYMEIYNERIYDLLDDRGARSRFDTSSMQDGRRGTRHSFWRGVVPHDR